MSNPFAKENQFGTPFTLIPADEEYTHLKALMANVQAYIDHPDAEEPTKTELQHALDSLKESATLLNAAMSPCPRV